MISAFHRSLGKCPVRRGPGRGDLLPGVRASRGHRRTRHRRSPRGGKQTNTNGFGQSCEADLQKRVALSPDGCRNFRVTPQAYRLLHGSSELHAPSAHNEGRPLCGDRGPSSQTILKSGRSIGSCSICRRLVAQEERYPGLTETAMGGQ
jgi:hypothetical protein